VNNGDNSIRVINVVPSCSCVTAELEGDVVPAGGRTAIDITVDGAGRRGPFAAKVLVSTDDANRPHRMIEISGAFYDTANGLTASPADLRLDGVTTGRAIKQVFRVTRAGGRPVGSLRATSSDPSVAIHTDREHSSDHELVLGPV
jgi:hypothetical protein